MVLLSEEMLAYELTRLPHWHVNGHMLECVFTPRTYQEGLELAYRIGQLSETADHHPEIILAYKKVTIRYWTHTVNGITERDIQLAQQVEQLIREQFPS